MAEFDAATSPFNSALEEQEYLAEFDRQHRLATIYFLSKLSQTTSVADFQASFEDLMQGVTGLFEPSLISLFIAGLRPEIRRELLRLTWPSTLKDAFAQARAYETHSEEVKHQIQYSALPKPTSSSPPTPSIPCARPPTYQLPKTLNPRYPQPPPPSIQTASAPGPADPPPAPKPTSPQKYLSLPLQPGEILQQTPQSSNLSSKTIPLPNPSSDPPSFLQIHCHPDPLLACYSPSEPLTLPNPLPDPPSPDPPPDEGDYGLAASRKSDDSAVNVKLGVSEEISKGYTSSNHVRKLRRRRRKVHLAHSSGGGDVEEPGADVVSARTGTRSQPCKGTRSNACRKWSSATSKKTNPDPDPNIKLKGEPGPEPDPNPMWKMTERSTPVPSRGLRMSKSHPPNWSRRIHPSSHFNVEMAELKPDFDVKLEQRSSRNIPPASTRKRSPASLLKQRYELYLEIQNIVEIHDYLATGVEFSVGICQVIKAGLSKKLELWDPKMKCESVGCKSVDSGVGSIVGWVILKLFDMLKSSAMGCVFKRHTKLKEMEYRLIEGNNITHNPRIDAFVTGDNEGCAINWDAQCWNKLYEFKKIDDVERVFDEMPKREIVLWNTMSSDLVELESFLEALGMFLVKCFSTSARGLVMWKEIPTVVPQMFALVGLGEILIGNQFPTSVVKLGSYEQIYIACALSLMLINHKLVMEYDVVTTNMLLSSWVRVMKLDYARKVLDDFVLSHGDSVQEIEECKSYRIGKDIDMGRILGSSGAVSSSHPSMSEGECKEYCCITLDSGKKFFVHDVGEDGLLSMLEEVGSDKMMTLQEFEVFLSLSNSVQQFNEQEHAVTEEKQDNCAEMREMRNFLRVKAVGIRCLIIPILLRLHVLVMEFIGKAGRAAPRMTDASLSEDKLRECYVEIITMMQTLYQKLDFLLIDCVHVSDLFKKGSVAVMSVKEFRDLVLDPPISDEAVDDYLEKAQQNILDRFESKVQDDKIVPTVYVQTLDHVKTCEDDLAKAVKPLKKTETVLLTAKPPCAIGQKSQPAAASGGVGAVPPNTTLHMAHEFSWKADAKIVNANRILKRVFDARQAQGGGLVVRDEAFKSLMNKCATRRHHSAPLECPPVDWFSLVDYLKNMIDGAAQLFNANLAILHSADSMDRFLIKQDQANEEVLLRLVELEVLIHWLGRPPEDTTWNALKSPCKQYPIFHLEDKVVLKGKRIDTIVVTGFVFYETNAREPTVISLHKSNYYKYWDVLR